MTAHTIPPLQWKTQPAEPTLGPDEVSVWRAVLDQPAACIHQMEATLSAEELTRARAFCFERDRRRFIVGRGVLRNILSAYLGIDAHRVAFSYSPFGKPALADVPSQAAGLTFNLSHSQGLALYALTRGRNIGVDLESMRPNVAIDDLAARFFAPGEAAGLKRYTGNASFEAFYTCWCRKEAFIKAKGKGLTIPLDQFEVSVDLDKPATLIATKWDPDEARRWWLTDLFVAPGYAAALSVEIQPRVLTCWHWSPC